MGGSPAISLAVLVVVLRVLHNSCESREGAIERLETLREQQERLKVMYQERSILREELERRRLAMDDEQQLRALPAPAEPEDPPEKGRGRVRRFFGF